MIPFNRLLSLWVSEANYFQTWRGLCLSRAPGEKPNSDYLTGISGPPHNASSPLRGNPNKEQGLGRGEGGPSPTRGRFPSSCLPRGWEAGDLEFTLLSCLFFPQTGSLLLSSLSERVRGCRPGHKGGLGRNLWACRVIHQTLPCCQLRPLPTQFPFQLLLGGGVLGGASPPTLEPCHNPAATRIPGPWGGGSSGGTPETLGKGQRLPPPTRSKSVKTQQVAMAWRKVAFVAVSKSPAWPRDRNKCWSLGEGEGEGQQAVPGACNDLPSPPLSNLVMGTLGLA